MGREKNSIDLHDLSFFLFLNSNKTARGEPREYTSSGGTKASVN